MLQKWESSICIANLFGEELLKSPLNKTTAALAEHLREQMSSSPGFSRPSYHTGEASSAFKNIQGPVFLGWQFYLQTRGIYVFRTRVAECERAAALLKSRRVKCWALSGRGPFCTDAGWRGSLRGHIDRETVWWLYYPNAAFPFCVCTCASMCIWLNGNTPIVC